MALIAGRFDEVVIEVIVRIEQAVRVVRAGLAQLEPVVGESIDETGGPRVGQQPLGLRP